MAQYKTGTVSVTNGAAVITGSGTQFLANATAGNAFKILGDPVVYQVAAVSNDLLINLSAPYAGPTQVNVGYQITRDYTANFGLAEISPNDVDWPTHLTVETIRKIDACLGGISYIHAQPTPAYRWTIPHNKNTTLTPVVKAYQTVPGGPVGCGLLNVGCGGGYGCGEVLGPLQSPLSILDTEVTDNNTVKINLAVAASGTAVIQFV